MPRPVFASHYHYHHHHQPPRSSLPYFGIRPTDLASANLERDTKRVQDAAILGRSGGVRSRTR